MVWLVVTSAFGKVDQGCLRTFAELIGDHSNFLILEVVIFYTKFKDNIYMPTTHTNVWVVGIVVIFKFVYKG